ncbi:MAG: hypothetical protein ABIN94_06980 [Ferruginibacter sp.]
MSNAKIDLIGVCKVCAELSHPPVPYYPQSPRGAPFSDRRRAGDEASPRINPHDHLTIYNDPNK